MNENLDLAAITDLNQLKALAYDQIAAINQAQQNLRVIEERIGQVSQTVLNGKVGAKA